MSTPRRQSSTSSRDARRIAARLSNTSRRVPVKSNFSPRIHERLTVLANSQNTSLSRLVDRLTQRGLDADQELAAVRREHQKRTVEALRGLPDTVDSSTRTALAVALLPDSPHRVVKHVVDESYRPDARTLAAAVEEWQVRFGYTRDQAITELRGMHLDDVEIGDILEVREDWWRNFSGQNSAATHMCWGRHVVERMERARQEQRQAETDRVEHERRIGELVGMCDTSGLDRVAGDPVSVVESRLAGLCQQARFTASRDDIRQAAFRAVHPDKTVTGGRKFEAATSVSKMISPTR